MEVEFVDSPDPSMDWKQSNDNDGSNKDIDIEWVNCGDVVGDI